MELASMEGLLRHLDNPLVKGVAAGAFTATAIAATTAFAPIGVVGAAGWTVVYGVAAGTAVLDAAERWLGPRGRAGRRRR